MSWVRDPFRSTLIIYSTLVVVAISMLFMTREALNIWYLEETALPLVEEEAATLEEIWQDEGLTEVQRWIKDNENDVFQYQLQRVSDPLLIKALDAEFATDNQSIELIPESDEVQLDDETNAFTIELYLPDLKTDRWYFLAVTLNSDVFAGPLRLFNLLLLAIALVLLAGLLLSYLMLRKVRRHLNDINHTAQTISQHRDLSARIQQGNLSGPLADTLAQINDMIAELEQSVLKSRQQADNIAHDLRTPLTNVQQKLQQLDLEQPELCDIEQQLSRLLHTFNLLLRINRLETNGENPPLEAVNLNELLEDIEDLYLPVFEDQDKHLMVLPPLTEDRTGDQPYRVTANRDLLFQVLCNLMDNASKYNPPGATITVTLSSSGANTELIISDESGGVPPELLDNLCDRFFRADNSRQAAGNGLGLSFVKAAMQQMNGSLTLSNQTTPNGDTTGLKVNLMFASDQSSYK